RHRQHGRPNSEGHASEVTATGAPAPRGRSEIRNFRLVHLVAASFDDYRRYYDPDAVLDVVQALLALLVSRRLKVTLKLDSVVQNADDLDHARCRYSIDDKMSSTTTMSRNMKRSNTGDDFVPSLGPINFRPLAKLADRLKDGVPIYSG